MATASAVTDHPYIGIMGLRGRNGSDTSLLIPDTQCLEAMNVDWFRSGVGRKRGGAAAFSLASSGLSFTGGVRSLGRFVPGIDQTAAEFWAVAVDLRFHRLAAGVTWADPSQIDLCASLPQEVVFQSFNGLCYMAYDSVHNRLHAWDGTSIRRIGLDLPAAIAAPTTSAGAVTDTRKYRIAWTRQVSGVTVERSNLSVASPSVALAVQRATATKSTAPGEGETHWELYAASTPTFSDYRLVATTVIGTATAEDNNATLPSTVAPADGANTPPPSARYLVADDGRVIMGGCFETSANPENAMAPSDHRVWWTSVLNASMGGNGDGERISNTGTINGYADLEEAITGISQPQQIISSASSSLERGSFYVYSYESQWKFVSTGDASAPYLKFRITGGSGCIHHKSICTAIDENGQPATYWASKLGIMRIASEGQEYLGEDVVDIWATINLEADVPCHTVHIPDLHQVWFYVATGTSTYPNERIVFDTRLGRIQSVAGVRGGWSRAQGESAKAYCSCLFSNTVAATMSRKLKPYIGYTGDVAIWKCDTTDLTDGGVAFQAYVDSKSYAPWGLDRLGGLRDDVMVVANPAASTAVRLTVCRNEGEDETISDVDLTDHSDSGSAALVFVKAGGSKLADSFTFRCRIGDSQAKATTWNIQALIAPSSLEGDA